MAKIIGYTVIFYMQEFRYVLQESYISLKLTKEINCVCLQGKSPCGSTSGGSFGNFRDPL